MRTYTMISYRNVEDECAPMCMFTSYVDTCFECDNYDYQLKNECDHILRPFSYYQTPEACKMKLEWMHYQIQTKQNLELIDHIDAYLNDIQSDYQMTDETGKIVRHFNKDIANNYENSVKEVASENAKKGHRHRKYFFFQTDRPDQFIVSCLSDQEKNINEIKREARIHFGCMTRQQKECLQIPLFASYQIEKTLNGNLILTLSPLFSLSNLDKIKKLK